MPFRTYPSSLGIDAVSDMETQFKIDIASTDDAAFRNLPLAVVDALRTLVKDLSPVMHAHQLYTLHHSEMGEAGKPEHYFRIDGTSEDLTDALIRAIERIRVPGYTLALAHGPGLGVVFQAAHKTRPQHNFWQDVRNALASFALHMR